MPGPVGVFVVVEGPNGVGKTTVCQALTKALVAIGTRVHATAEPTQTSLGRAIRELEPSMPPRALALSCAADRYDHLTREVEPRLAESVLVVCDRYVPSSLVLQRSDGLDLEWIWSLNDCAIRPQLTVYLEHDPETIGIRLDQRGRRSRFEAKETPAVELEYYREAREFLARKGWNHTVIDCRSRTPTEIAAIIISELS